MWDRQEKSTECRVPEDGSWVWNVPLFETAGLRLPDVNSSSINAKNVRAEGGYAPIVNGCLYGLVGSAGLALLGYFFFETDFLVATLFVVGGFLGGAIYVGSRLR